MFIFLCLFCHRDSTHICGKLESALSVVQALKEEKARLTQLLERIRDDLNRNVR